MDGSLAVDAAKRRSKLATPTTRNEGTTTPSHTSVHPILLELIASRMRRPGGCHQIQNPPVMRRENVEMVWRHQGRGWRAKRCREAGVGAGPRIDGLNLARFLDRNVYKAARRIKKGGIRRAAKRP